MLFVHTVIIPFKYNNYFIVSVKNIQFVSASFVITQVRHQMWLQVINKK